MNSQLFKTSPMFDSVEIVRATPLLTVDLDEGTTTELGCLNCREDVTAKLGMGTPVRMYVAALYCDSCMEELVSFDVMSRRVA